MNQDYDSFADEEILGLDSPTDFDEYEMNPDDCSPDDYSDEGRVDS